MNKAIENTEQDFPPAFLEKMSRLLGAEYPEFLTCLNQPAINGIRVNTLKISQENFSVLSPWRLSPVPWCKNGFSIFDFNDDKYLIQPGKHPYHAAGLYYLQEPSAMIAAEALAPKPGDKVLDLAAAPGGKSTHLAGLMHNTGLLLTNEIHPRRVWDLAENLERCGVTNAIITNETPRRLADHFGEYFDRVLLDAPCSGEGMFRKSINARNEWSAELPYSCAIRQAGILEQAARMVKPGGTLAYTTCTFSPEENEGVIANFLNQHPDFKIKPIPIINGMRRAMPEWIGQSQDHVVRLADRIWPHLSQGEGHFIALFTKINTLHPEFDIKHLHEIDFRNKSSKQDKQTSMKLLDDFSNTYLNITFNKARLSMVGSYLYQLPEGSPDLSGLKVIHHGWWLGSIQKNRFTPSHALAIGMDMNDAKHRCSLKLNDQRATQYLHGESISDLGENGWTLITYDGFPLGWGKRVNNVIKNYYPHGLRRFI